MNLEVGSAGRYNVSFPNYDLPIEIGQFSMSSDGKYCNDNHQLKYLAMPSKMKGLKMDLNEGFSNYIHVKDESENDYKTILKWIVNHQDEVEKHFMDHFTSRTTIDFVCFKGALKRICSTIYQKFGKWRILAKKHKSTIYLADITDDEEYGEKRRRRESNLMKLSVKERQMWTWGYKFNQYMTSDTMHSRPSTSVPVNENEKCYSVMKGKYGNYTLLFAGSGYFVDPVFLDAQGHDSTSVQRYVLLYTSRKVESERQKRNFLSYKMLQFYLQSFLAGIPRVICGFRDDDGIVGEISSYSVEDMPKMAHGNWSAAACMNFGLRFLDFVKEVVVKDYSEAEYVFSFSAGRDITCKEMQGSQESFPEWYIQNLRI